jgi:hypothetical protein
VFSHLLIIILTAVLFYSSPDHLPLSFLARTLQQAIRGAAAICPGAGGSFLNT